MSGATVPPPATVVTPDPASPPAPVVPAPAVAAAAGTVPAAAAPAVGPTALDFAKLQQQVAESNARWAAVGAHFTPAGATPVDPQQAAKDALLAAEAGLRTANTAALVMRVTEGRVYEPMDVAELASRGPEFAIDLRTKQFVNPAAAEQALRTYVTARPHVLRPGPAAAPVAATAAPVIPGTAVIPNAPPPPNTPTTAAPVAQVMDIGQLFGAPLEILRKM